MDSAATSGAFLLAGFFFVGVALAFAFGAIAAASYAGIICILISCAVYHDRVRKDK